MNKALEYLEEYCQWLAIAVGGLFLVWVLYTYVLATPVTVGTGTQVYTPANVDLAVEKSAQELNRRINSADVPTPPDSQGGEVTKNFNTELTGTAIAKYDLRPGALGDTKGIIIEVDSQKNNNDRPVVAEAPVLPTPIPQTAKSARANYQPPPAAAGAAGAAGSPAPVAGRDVTYVKFDYAIPMNKVAEAFSAVKILPLESKTSFLAVELWRREKRADGTFSEATQIQRIDNSEPVLPLPAKPSENEAKALQSWSEAPPTPGILLRPTFYTVLMGEGPFDPPAKIPVDEVDAAEKAKAEEAAAKLAAEREARKQAQQQKPRPTPAPPGAPRGATRGGAAGKNRNNGVVGDDRAHTSPIGEQLAQAGPPPRDVPDFMGVGPNGAAPGAMPPAAPNQPPADAVPGANFLPAQVAPNLVGWAYDTTVEEGKVYQYQVVYALKNPVYLTNGNVAAPNISATFAFSTKLDDQNWSDDVTVEPSTYFFVAQSNWTPANIPNAVKMVVFKWAAGKWQMATIGAPGVAAGDRIGQATQIGPVNFGTNYTLVDVRYDDRSNRAYVVILGPSGELIERDPKIDRDSKLRKALEILAAGAQPPVGQPAPAAGAPPGPPPGAAAPGGFASR